MQLFYSNLFSILCKLAKRVFYWTDFHDFSPTDRYLFVDNQSQPLFPIPQGMLPWQPILGQIGKLTFIWQSGVPKWIGTVTPKITRVTTVSFKTTQQK